MALIEILRHVRLVLNDDGTVRSVTSEYDEKDDLTGRIVPKGTRRVRAADLMVALPDAATLVAAVDAANAERDAANAERDAANAERDAANAERDAAVLAMTPQLDPAQKVRDEAARRLRVLLGARDEKHLSETISNAQRESARLYAIRIGIPGVVAAREWTEAEAARAAQLHGADAAIEAIRAASNALEPDPPADFAHDSHWPPNT